MNKIIFEYQLESNLTDSIRLIAEIESEIGMTPIALVTETERLTYNPDDAAKVLAGEFTEQQYTNRNKIN